MTSSRQVGIVLATSNPGKIREMRQLLGDLGPFVQSPDDFSEPPVVVEDRPDLQGNALKKARAWHARTGLIAVGDDTGLEVAFLGGAPGVYSARYAGEDGNADANMRKLLSNLRKASGSDRAAQFRCVVAVVSDTGEQVFEGVCKGRIAKKRTGIEGFGYDPIFVPDGYDRSFAEISATEKNEISHRGKAVRAAATYIEQTARELPSQ